MQLAAARSQAVAVALQPVFSWLQVAVHWVATGVLGVKPGPVDVAQAARSRLVSVMPDARSMRFLPLEFSGRYSRAEAAEV